ncbi:MetQ/NlpA family ABC transporter substrate-binding protein [Paenibacillus sp. SYP-B4298]|uniref:MetQ/NlpA family ABC transporter substrate-binding protein n=1 Tax=Paenibacillus sp. SYP-B4298 TaxID=2996034 RepID=UPI0022DE8798|nr:MetQ/NlpA family ABC transporter substrate-binding protein [Paenibacillus sp. SYP-B4298]
MKKSLFIVFALVLVLAGCGQKGTGSTNTPAANDTTGGAGNTQIEKKEEPAAEPITLKVGASPVPHAEILESVIPVLKEQGINLEISEFTDYVLPNVQLYEKQLDVNFFQHVPYLDQFNKDKNYDLVQVAGVHVEPFGVYSSKLKSIDELQDGAKIAIPNDPSNGGRALLLLAQHGLITLDESKGVEVTVADIKDNPRSFEIVELEAATLPRVLDEVAIATINTNYALEAGLNPTEDALFIEDKDSPYVNIVAARPDNKDSEAIQKLVAALQTPEVEKFINEKYKGAVVPAFK